MTWASHLTVGYALARVTGMNPITVGIGAILPDLVEEMPGVTLRHRGISHSLALHAVLLLALVVQPGSGGGFVKRPWRRLYEEGVIDKREYLEHRFWLF